MTLYIKGAGFQPTPQQELPPGRRIDTQIAVSLTCGGNVLRRNTCLLIWTLIWLLTLSGCGRAVNRAAERRIRESLPDLLGNARQYRVHVDSPPTRTLQGRLASVTIDGEDVQFPNGPLVDGLHLDLKGVDYDVDHRTLRHIDSARFAARIGQTSLDEFLAGEAPAGETLREVRVILSGDNLVTIRGKRITLGLRVPFEISGPLLVAGPKRVEIDPQRLRVAGVPIPGLLRDFLKSRFESGIDLGSLPFPIHLTNVTTSPGTLTISGTADVADMKQVRRQERQ